MKFQLQASRVRKKLAVPEGSFGCALHICIRSIEKDKVAGVRVSKKNKSVTILIKKKKRKEEMARSKLVIIHLKALVPFTNSTRLHINIKNLPEKVILYGMFDNYLQSRKNKRNQGEKTNRKLRAN